MVMHDSGATFIPVQVHPGSLLWLFTCIRHNTSTPEGGIVPYNNYTGMCRPTGSCFWDSDLKRGIIFKLFSRMGYNISNAPKLINIIGDFNSRTGYYKIACFFKRAITSVANPF